MADVSGRIEIAGLSKTFGTTRAVDDLSFVVEPGSVTAFLGPNGAGKTTTLRMLLGLVAPNAGTATIGGQRYVALDRPNDVVGAVLESSSFHPGRSGRNHLRVYCTVNGYPDRRADEVLELVGLSGAADRTVRGYSLGMRQRLGLAAALLGDPYVLILDEPANGLDPPGIAWLRGFLRTLAEKGRTILVSSHVLSEVQQTADRVVIINQGRLVREGTLEDLSAGHGQTVRVRSPHAERLATALRAKAAEVRVGDSYELHVTGLDAQEVGHVAFVEQVELHTLETEQDDLEQIFFALTGMGAEPDGAATGGVRE
jgi:ABC-2 type transport system ATP-binding protein